MLLGASQANIAPSLIYPVGNQSIHQRLFKSSLQSTCSPLRVHIPGIDDFMIVEDHVGGQQSKYLSYPLITRPGLYVHACKLFKRLCSTLRCLNTLLRESCLFAPSYVLISIDLISDEQ